MTTEITKPQKVILLKSGLPIWCEEDRVKKLEEMITAGTGHKFVKIDDRVINSAEIEGIYTPQQFEDIEKLKQGMWQCSMKTWHAKKAECNCAIEARRKEREQWRIKTQIEENKPRTPEEMQQIGKVLKSIRADLEKKGVLPPK